jgi:hypothetical protein
MQLLQSAAQVMALCTGGDLLFGWRSCVCLLLGSPSGCSWRHSLCSSYVEHIHQVVLCGVAGAQLLGVLKLPVKYEELQHTQQLSSGNRKQLTR